MRVAGLVAGRVAALLALVLCCNNDALGTTLHDPTPARVDLARVLQAQHDAQHDAQQQPLSQPQTPPDQASGHDEAPLNATNLREAVEHGLQQARDQNDAESARLWEELEEPLRRLEEMEREHNSELKELTGMVQSLEMVPPNEPAIASLVQHTSHAAGDCATTPYPMLYGYYTMLVLAFNPSPDHDDSDFKLPETPKEKRDATELAPVLSHLTQDQLGVFDKVQNRLPELPKGASQPHALTGAVTSAEFEYTEEPAVVAVLTVNRGQARTYEVVAELRAKLPPSMHTHLNSEGKIEVRFPITGCKTPVVISLIRLCEDVQDPGECLKECAANENPTTVILGAINTVNGGLAPKPITIDEATCLVRVVDARKTRLENALKAQNVPTVVAGDAVEFTQLNCKEERSHILAFIDMSLLDTPKTLLPSDPVVLSFPASEMEITAENSAKAMQELTHLLGDPDFVGITAALAGPTLSLSMPAASCPPKDGLEVMYAPRCSGRLGYLASLLRGVGAHGLWDPPTAHKLKKSFHTHVQRDSTPR